MECPQYRFVVVVVVVVVVFAEDGMSCLVCPDWTRLPTRCVRLDSWVSISFAVTFENPPDPSVLLVSLHHRLHVVVEAVRHLQQTFLDHCVVLVEVLLVDDDPTMRTRRLWPLS